MGKSEKKSAVSKNLWQQLSADQRKAATAAATAGRIEQARKARLARAVDEVVANAGDLGPAQLAALRSLLPPVRGVSSMIMPDGSVMTSDIEAGP